MKIIKLSEEQIKFLKGSINKNHEAQTGYNQACYNIKSTHEKIWKKIKDIFPDYSDMELNWEEKELIINDT